MFEHSFEMLTSYQNRVVVTTGTCPSKNRYDPIYVYILEKLDARHQCCRKRLHWFIRSPRAESSRWAILITLCLSSVVCPSSFTFGFKHHLLLNRTNNFHKTSQECSFGRPLSNLFKGFNSMENFGCCGIRKGAKCPNFKNLLLQICLSDSNL